MPSIIRKAFIASMSIIFFAILTGGAFASQVNYIYDELDRLTEVKYPDGTIIKYSYDELGNITHRDRRRSGYIVLTVQAAGTGIGTVTSNPAGIDCGYVCSGQYALNMGVTLTALPDSASYFTGWSGEGCSGTGPCSISLNSDKAVTATFTLKPKLTVTKNGTGAGGGTVVSSPAGINCGSSCIGPYMPGTVVTLTTSTVAGYAFAGWSGGGCSGTGPCQISLNSDAAVTATFNMLPPIAGFTCTPTTGDAPYVVTCTDTTIYNPASWLWDFGDGTTSDLKNPPPHVYASVGTFTVSLTASNIGGANKKTITNYITAKQCTNLPVRNAVTMKYYSTLQAAYDDPATTNGAVLQMLGLTFTQNLNVNRDISVTMEGGKTCDCAATINATTLQGSITTSLGTLTGKDFIVIP